VLEEEQDQIIGNYQERYVDIWNGSSHERVKCNLSPFIKREKHMKNLDGV
jgi:hypothetical protein